MDLDKLKQIQLDMLIHFIRICERHNLQYFLVGGTALGTVRHQGFIPWDDDIEVGMPRNDYENFLKIASTELPAYLFLQTRATDKYYPMNFVGTGMVYIFVYGMFEIYGYLQKGNKDIYGLSICLVH